MIQCHPKTSEAYQLFHDGTLVLAKAERQGIRIDMEYAEKKKKQLTYQIQLIEERFMSSNFYRHWKHSLGERKPNINSNPQLAKFLYVVKKIKPLTTTELGDQGSTDEDALIQLNIPELNDLLQLRKLKKVRDTYLESFIREQIDGFIHPDFNLHLVRTFRSSSSSPNFQNIPKRDKESMNVCRRALYPRLGHQIMEADFSGLEVRVAACYHQDPRMIQYIENPVTDMHRDMAQEIFLLDNFDKKNPDHKVLRYAAKNGFVFPQFYGDYYVACAYNLACKWGQLPNGRWKPGQGIPLNGGTLSDHLLAHKITSLNKFTDHIQKIEKDFWYDRFPVYRKWKERQWIKYQRLGYTESLTGFIFQGVMGKNDVINYPIQGAAFHCLLWSLIQVDQYLSNKNTAIIGQIHDSGVFDVHPDEFEEVTRTIKQTTCYDLSKAWDWIIVPMEIEIEAAQIDESWAEIKSILI